ncbi:MAG: hypothetical protein ACREIP_03600, partial [Alphaproteobacteria bacterium]
AVRGLLGRFGRGAVHAATVHISTQMTIIMCGFPHMTRQRKWCLEIKQSNFKLLSYFFVLGTAFA